VTVGYDDATEIAHSVWLVIRRVSMEDGSWSNPYTTALRKTHQRDYQNRSKAPEYLKKLELQKWFGAQYFQRQFEADTR